MRHYDSSVGTGSLVSHGSFDFGSVISSPSVLPAPVSLSSDLSFAAVNNVSLASTLNLTSAIKNPADGSSQYLSAPYVRQSSLDPAKVDVARSAIQDSSNSAFANSVIAAILAANYVPGNKPAREQVFINGFDHDTDAPNTWDSRDSRGLSLSKRAFGIMNAQRPSTSQVGFNSGRIGGDPE
jgi:hypothetical protein